MNTTRELDTAPPPAYARVVTRAYKKDLRPIIIFFTTIGMIWSFFVGATYLRDATDSNEAQKLKIVDGVMGGLCLIVAAFETFGLVAAATRRLKLIKIYMYLAFASAAIIFITIVLRIVFHFVMKEDIISDCQQGSDYGYTNSPLAQIPDTQNTREDCESLWKRDIAYVIAWLIGLAFYAAFSTSLATAYYHQSKNPENLRMNAPSAAYQMNAYAHNDTPFQTPAYTPGYGQAGQYAPPTYGPYDQSRPPTYTGGDFKAPSDEKEGGYETSETTLRGVDLNDGPSEGRRPDNGHVV